MVFIGIWEDIIIAFLSLIAIILIILHIIETKLRHKIKRHEENKNIFYIKEVEKIDKSYPKKTLKSINKITRNFLIDTFGIKASIEYSKLKNFFVKKNNIEIAKFCDNMTNILYSGKKANKRDNQKLIKSLLRIIQNNHIPTREEKEELRKKELKKSKGIIHYLKNIKIPGINQEEFKNKNSKSKNK